MLVRHICDHSAPTNSFQLGLHMTTYRFYLNYNYDLCNTSSVDIITAIVIN